MHVISTSLPRQMHKINVTNKYFIQTLKLHFEFNSFQQDYTGVYAFTYTPVIKYKPNNSLPFRLSLSHKKIINMNTGISNALV